MSAITTRLDCNSCPVTATIRPATSGTNCQRALVAMGWSLFPNSAASRTVKPGTAAPAPMLTTCPATGMIPNRTDIAVTRSGYPGGQKNGGGGCRCKRLWRRGPVA